MQPEQNVCIKLEQDESFLVYASVKKNGLAAVAICDSEYPDKVAIKVCHDVLREFEQLFTIQQIDTIQEDKELKFNK